MVSCKIFADFISSNNTSKNAKTLVISWIGEINNIYLCKGFDKDKPHQFYLDC